MKSLVILILLLGSKLARPQVIFPTDSPEESDETITTESRLISAA